MNITLGKNGKHVLRSGKRSGLAAYGAKIGSTARQTGRSALHQVQDFTGKTKSKLFPSKETLLGLGLLTHLLKDREGRKVQTIRLTRKDVTDDFVEKLASALEKRLSHSGELKKALVEPLRGEVPHLRRIPERRPYRMGWMTRLGMIALAGYGLNYLIVQLTGKNVIDFATEQIKGMQRTGAESDEKIEGSKAHRGYRDIHGTAGAEMPDIQPHENAPVSADPAQEEMGESTGI